MKYWLLKRLLPIAFLLACSLLSLAYGAEGVILIGQSLPLSGKSFYSASRILAGSEGYVAQINQRGGVNGKKVKLVTLDDGNDLERYKKNFLALVQEYQVSAVLNCVGDIHCREASKLATEFQVPLIGGYSGGYPSMQGNSEFLFPLRPSYKKETELMARQLTSMGTTMVAILSNADGNDEKLKELSNQLRNKNAKVKIITLNPKLSDSDVKSIRSIEEGQYQAVILDVDSETMDNMVEKGLLVKTNAMVTISLLSSANFTHIARSFKNRNLGYISVVPDPENLTIPIVSELNKAALNYTGSEAVTFEGLEAYIATNVTLQGIRRTPNLSRIGLARSLRSMTDVDLGGFVVSFGKNRSGSDWANVGLRSKSGLYSW